MPRTCPLLDVRAKCACEERYEAVQQALAENRAELKRQQTAARQETKKAMAVWKLSTFVLNVVLILFSLSQSTCPCPVAFLCQHGQAKGWPAKEEEDLVIIVQQAFMQIDLDAYVNLTDSDNSSNPTAMQVAIRFRSSYSTQGWVKGLNQGKGIAPPSALVGAKLAEFQSQYPMHFGYRNMSLPWQSNYRVVVHRWRRSFGNRYGRIRRRDVISSREMQDKVGPLLA